MRTVEINLEDCVVIVLRTEETRAQVIEAFASDLDRQRALAWLATQPRLLELLVAALRASGHGDGLDLLTDRVGSSPGDDREWLQAWARLEPTERRRAAYRPDG